MELATVSHPTMEMTALSLTVQRIALLPTAFVFATIANATHHGEVLRAMSVRVLT